jgi:uncharacterized membrane protein
VTGSRAVNWQAGLGVLGLLISGYLVATHYFEQVPLACSTGGFVDCEQVTSSAESMVGPLPVAVLGVVWFGGFLVLLAMGASRLRLAWTVLGLVSVFYLVYAELFLIGALCLWCTAVHLIVAVLFLGTLWEATSPEATLAPRRESFAVPGAGSPNGHPDRPH